MKVFLGNAAFVREKDKRRNLRCVETSSQSIETKEIHDIYLYYD